MHDCLALDALRIALHMYEDNTLANAKLQIQKNDATIALMQRKENDIRRANPLLFMTPGNTIKIYVAPFDETATFEYIGRARLTCDGSETCVLRMNDGHEDGSYMIFRELVDDRYSVLDTMTPYVNRDFGWYDTRFIIQTGMLGDVIGCTKTLLAMHMGQSGWPCIVSLNDETMRWCDLNGEMPTQPHGQM